ncbi:Polymer-forming protein [Butyrivibrio proteoclasticus]|uniref:Polymer-forming protein n=1 Tax=Butyrivibrio proteoclasticus TaxID=43305 RepID=A0A1I5TI36_9FIRM|nr:polymer-forming cytoskeletal protein [Butyrivibrio proteoclasticus]SFP82685.1 Polymer-forming protein [Butyrivibrio proteoclasticus]
MGFFSELKSDLSQAVNTLMPEDKLDEAAGLDNEKGAGESAQKGDGFEKVDIESMLDRIDDIKLDEAAENGKTSDESTEPAPVQAVAEKEPAREKVAQPVKLSEKEEEELLEERIEEQTTAEVSKPAPLSAIEMVAAANANEYIAETTVSENNTNNGGNEMMDFEQQTPTDETASITEGMTITGDLQTTGSLDLIGKVTGNIKCLGKLNITGEIVGDSDAAEVYAESARINGEVKSKGSVKVGQSTVIVGNIFGTSAVIAGAVKGDIDVHGPVVLDTTAIVMGNIKSQSVQINNGAVIEGMCSQAYADVNPSEFFEGLKNR